jgi:hypothetical protein
MGEAEGRVTGAMCGEEIDSTVSARGVWAGRRPYCEAKETKRIQKINGSAGQRVSGSPADQRANTTIVVHVNIRVDHDPSRD